MKKLRQIDGMSSSKLVLADIIAFQNRTFLDQLDSDKGLRVSLIPSKNAV